MIYDSNTELRRAVDVFRTLYANDRRDARIYLLSLFAIAYSVMTPEERLAVTTSIFSLVRDIKDELFEDGQDFVDFLKEKSSHLNPNFKEPYGQNDGNIE